MTFEELKRILIKETVDPDLYDILDTGYIGGYDGYVIKKSAHGYDLYYMERGQYDFLDSFSNEHDVSIALIKELADYCEPQLQKYV